MLIPQDWQDNNRLELSDDIRFLMHEGQFRAVRPDTLIDRGNSWLILEEFEKEFIDVVKSEKFKSIIKKRRDLSIRIHGGKVPKVGMVEKGARIHQNKTTMGLFNFLEDQHLARIDRTDRQWFRFESSTALLYMSILAKYLARIDTQSTVIGTDKAVYEKLNFQPVKDNEVSAVMSIDLKGIIPSPSRNVAIKDIIKFKRLRESNLIAFRKVLFDVQSKISAAESNEHVKEIAISFKEDLRKGLTDMAAVYKDSKIELVLKSLKSLIDYKSSTALTGAALLLDEKYKITGLPESIKVLAIAAVATINVSTIYIDVRNKQRAEDRKSAFSYLYHAQRRGIINRLS